MNRSDFIVVGAGSAGCILASRLASEFGYRVTLVEPPSTPAPSADRERPSRWLNLLRSGEDWDLQTETNVSLASRRLAWPRGRGLGGSSRINAMIWFPPTDRDLNSLITASGNRWTSEEILEAYDSTYRLVKPEAPRWLSEPSRRFLRAVDGHPAATPMIYERVNRGGRRWTPASLLTEPGIHGNQVEVVRATVDRLVWDRQRAAGVHLVQGTSTQEVRSEHGVVLCAGAIATPAILMRSGIGPGELLRRHEIDVRCELSAIGSNLQDHLIMPVVFQTRTESTFEIHPSVRDIAHWQTMGGGPISSNLAECGGLLENGKFQVHVTPTHYLTFPTQGPGPEMTIGVNLTQPTSRGSIQLRSRDPHEAPVIGAGYLTTDADRDGMIAGVRSARAIATQSSLRGWIDREVLPGVKRASDESIAKSIARYSQTLYHPCGTCSLGADDDAVDDAVDANFGIRGSEHLWVADASILPRLTIGNPSAVVMTLASMAATKIAQSG